VAISPELITAYASPSPITGPPGVDYTRPIFYTDASGSYVVTVAITGVYRLHFEPPTGSPYFAQVSADLTVRASVTGVNAVLPAGYTVRGKTVDAGTGAPLLRVLVDAVLPDKTLAARGGSESSNIFAIVVPAGTYRIRFRAVGYNEMWWKGASTFESATPLSVAADITDIDAALTRITSTSPSASPAVATATPASSDAVSGRVFVDQLDDFGGPQIHYMYVLPADGNDERLDINGAIATSVASIQNWISSQTAGRRLRVDTFRGRVDVTFYRLRQTDAQVAASGAYVRDRIEQELKAAGLTSPGKLYAVFYGGGSTYACGGGAWPPVLPGIVAAQYLKGTPPGAIPCSTNPVGASTSQPGYEDFAMLHELLHTMGIIASCAPHFTQAGHVSDDPRDLMYAGPQPWRPSILDVGHDDYYTHGNAACLDLGKLPWLTP